LKLKCDEPLSNVAFNFNVRRYTAVFFRGKWIDNSMLPLDVDIVFVGSSKVLTRLREW
jgi:hypothetical protein